MDPGEKGVDREACAAIGSPVDPMPSEVARVREVARVNRMTALTAPQATSPQGSKLTVQLSPNALLLIAVRRQMFEDFREENWRREWDSNPRYPFE